MARGRADEDFEGLAIYKGYKEKKPPFVSPKGVYYYLMPFNYDFTLM